MKDIKEASCLSLYAASLLIATGVKIHVNSFSLSILKHFSILNS
jgi:hypothetical protein